MNFDEYTISFLLYAPAKSPQGWNLDLSEFGQALREAYPQVRYQPEEGHPKRLSFWALTDDGVEYTGFADNETRHTIALGENTIDEVAPFICWLRDTYLPSPDLVRFTSELAYARGIETDWRIPATGSEEQIIDEIQQHLRTVVGE